ncbi:MAG: hypothetical protein AAGC71_11930 [Pseudomonadota bacterium]
MVATESRGAGSSKSAAVAVVLAGVISALAWAYLAMQSGTDGEGLSRFVSVAGVVLALQIIVVGGFHRMGWRMPLIVVVVFAAVFRIIGVAGAPLLEDDHFRFMWDGRSTVELGTPYGHAPADFFDADLGTFEPVLDDINHPDIPTVYGPASQWTFALAYVVAPANVWPLQLISALADFALVLLLARIATPLVVFLYAWAPLPIKEFAFTAHPDSVGAVLLLGAFIAFKARRELATGAMLALALGVKPFALVLAPYFLGFSLRAWVACVATMLALGLPFGLADAWLPSGLGAMASVWLFNAPAYFLALHLGGAGAVQGLKAVFVIAFSAWWASRFVPWIWRWFRHRDIAVDAVPAALSTGLFLAILPVWNPWYVVWWLPFAALGPLRLTPWVAAAALLLSYITGINVDSDALALYQQPTWVLVAEVVIITAALAFDIRVVRRQRAAT